MSTYLERKGATAVIRAEGVPLADSALANMASQGTGPAYAVINGRALYTREALMAWINEQARKPIATRRRSAA